MRQLIILFTLASLFCHNASAAALQCNSVFAAEVKSPSESIEAALRSVRQSLGFLKRHLDTADGKQDKLLHEGLKGLPEDPREVSYILQGAYRLIISHPDATKILGHKTTRKMYQGLDNVKTLEKVLGTYQNSRDLVKAAEKIEAPADFIEHLKKQRRQVAKKTVQHLKKNDFLSEKHNAIDDMIHHLTRVRKVENLAGEKLLTESLTSEISRVKQKVNEEMRPLINSKHYTHHELENGAHALRRSLRWLKVYVLAYRDHFKPTLPQRALTDSEKSLIAKYHDKEELKLNPDAEIAINQLDFYLLNDLIVELRKVKGIAEVRENLVLQLEDFGQWNNQKLSNNEARTIIEGLMKDNFEGIETRTQGLLQVYDNASGFNNLLVVEQP